jgi:hypothetical protein
VSVVAQVVWGIEVIAAVALAVAAVNGQTAIHSNGLHVTRLAYEHIGGTFLVGALAYCIAATVFTVRVVRSWARADGAGMLVGCCMAWLAASAYANAGPGFSMSGASAAWVSWPVTIWVVVLLSQFTISACRPRDAAYQGN